MQKIVIINTRCANFSSVMMALKRLGCESVVSDDADTIRSADKADSSGRRHCGRRNGEH